MATVKVNIEPVVQLLQILEFYSLEYIQILCNRRTDNANVTLSCL